MTLTEWAASYAEELLAPLGDRWAHVQGVARSVRQARAEVERCTAFVEGRLCEVAAS